MGSQRLNAAAYFLIGHWGCRQAGTCARKWRACFPIMPTRHRLPTRCWRHCAPRCRNRPRHAAAVAAAGGYDWPVKPTWLIAKWAIKKFSLTQNTNGSGSAFQHQYRQACRSRIPCAPYRASVAASDASAVMPSQSPACTMSLGATHEPPTQSVLLSPR